MPSFTEKLQVNGQEMDLYASVPSGSGPFPAVVIAFHIGGIDPFEQAMADRFAEAGYVAVIPDLFHRLNEEQLSGDRRGRLQYLDDVEILDEMGAALDFLKGNAHIDNDRISMTGFCMGGRVAWLMAATNSSFKAVVPFYGGNIMGTWGDANPTAFARTSGIDCPMLFHFGEIDANPSQEDMGKLDAELTRLGKAHEFHTYPEADHGFMDWTGLRHNADGAELAWSRTLDFFAAHVKRAAVPS